MLVPVYKDLSNRVSSSRNDQVNSQVINILRDRRYSPISLSGLSQSKDPETWSNLIIQALLSNLEYSGSQYGQFGTPDNDIIRAICMSHGRRWVWIKVLGTKIDTLISLSQGKISKTQLERIISIQSELKKIFTKPAQSGIEQNG